MKRGWIEHLDELHAFERVKFEKDGLDIFHDLPKYQRLGFDAIPLKEHHEYKGFTAYQYSGGKAGISPGRRSDKTVHAECSFVCLLYGDLHGERIL